MTSRPASLFAMDLIRPAIAEAFRKLHPRPMLKNPVMFVTMVGAALTTIAIGTAGEERLFVLLNEAVDSRKRHAEFSSRKSGAGRESWMLSTEDFRL